MHKKFFFPLLSRYCLLATFLLMVVCQAGCIFVPVIDSLKKSGLTASQRKEQLPKMVKAFHDTVFWGDSMRALALVYEGTRPEVADNLDQLLTEGRRVVQAKLLRADYGEDAFTADVEVETKSYTSETLLVKRSRIKQRWTFEVGDGWRLYRLGPEVAVH